MEEKQAWSASLFFSYQALAAQHWQHSSYSSGYTDEVPRNQNKPQNTTANPKQYLSNPSPSPSQGNAAWCHLRLQQFYPSLTISQIHVQKCQKYNYSINQMRVNKRDVFIWHGIVAPRTGASLTCTWGWSAADLTSWAIILCLMKWSTFAQPCHVWQAKRREARWWKTTRQGAAKKETHTPSDSTEYQTSKIRRAHFVLPWYSNP